MVRRHMDGFEQAEHNLEVARLLLREKAFDAACFHSQQAGELAAKAWLESQGKLRPGHSVRELLEQAGDVSEEIREAARELDDYYTTTLSERLSSGCAEGTVY